MENKKNKMLQISKTALTLGVCASILLQNAYAASASHCSGSMTVMNDPQGSKTAVVHKVVNDKIQFYFCPNLSDDVISKNEINLEKDCSVVGRHEGYSQEELNNRITNLSLQSNLVKGAGILGGIAGFVVGYRAAFKRLGRNYDPAKTDSLDILGWSVLTGIATGAGGAALGAFATSRFTESSTSGKTCLLKEDMKFEVNKTREVINSLTEVLAGIPNSDAEPASGQN